MYKAINGWTRETMIEQIDKEFKGKSMDPAGHTCIYRGDEGKKCAIGCFIPDGVTLSEDENKKGIQALLNGKPELKSLLPLSPIECKFFQQAHDDMLGSSIDVQKNYLINWIKENITN